MYHHNQLQKEKELETYSKATALFDFSNSISPKIKCPKCGSGEYTSVKVEDLSTYIDDLYHRYWVTCVCGETYHKDKSHNWMFGESKDNYTWEDFAFIFVLMVLTPVIACGTIGMISFYYLGDLKTTVVEKIGRWWNGCKKK